MRFYFGWLLVTILIAAVIFAYQIFPAPDDWSDLSWSEIRQLLVTNFTSQARIYQDLGDTGGWLDFFRGIGTQITQQIKRTVVPKRPPPTPAPARRPPLVVRGPQCGNTVCENGETFLSCPADCRFNPPPPVCNNNGLCEANETRTTCPGDCPAVSICGNNLCEAGETANNCPADCQTQPPPPVCNNNGNCEAGENNTNCPNDCRVIEPPLPPPPTPPALNHFLKFAQIRFYYSWRDEAQKPEPISNGDSLVSITWGAKFQGAEHYTYVYLGGLLNHWSANTDPSDYLFYYDKHRVYLTQQEALDLFQGGSQFNLGLMQLADVEKLYQTRYPNQPHPLGVVMNPDGSVRRDGSEPRSDGSTFEDYQEGRTLLLPVFVYDPLYPNQVLWNLANPVVREYIIDFAKKNANAYGTNKLALDNILILNNLSNARGRQYLAGSTDTEKYLNYARSMDSILQGLKSAGLTLWINSLRSYDTAKMVVQEYILQQGNYDAVLAEGSWHGCDWPRVNGLCVLGDLDRLNFGEEQWLKWLRMAGDRGKRIVFSLYNFSFLTPNSEDAYRGWLWAHLIANDKTYIFIDRSTAPPTTHYPFYDQPLGRPATAEPSFDPAAGVWTRNYEAGEITFKPGSRSSGDPGTISLCGDNQCSYGEDQFCPADC